MSRRSIAALLTSVLVAALVSTGPAWPAPAPADAGSTCRPTWRQVPSPNPSSSSFLRGVAAAGSRDIWTVGYEIDDVSEYTLTLTEHWDGTQWTTVPSPNGPDSR